MTRIFTDECNAQTLPSLQIDFSAAIWAINNLNDIFHQAGIPLNDVDFIAETDREIIFIECKNANRIDAAKPDKFCPTKPDKIENIARKYFDSLNFCRFSNWGVDKRKIYCYLIEAKAGSLSQRNQIRNLLYRKLPFNLQAQNQFPINMIDDLQVLSFDEWNQMYPQFKLTRLVAPISQN